MRRRSGGFKPTEVPDTLMERARQEIAPVKITGAQRFLKAIFCRPSAPTATRIGTAEVLVCVGYSETGISAADREDVRMEAIFVLPSA